MRWKGSQYHPPNPILLRTDALTYALLGLATYFGVKYVAHFVLSYILDGLKSAAKQTETDTDDQIISILIEEKNSKGFVRWCYRCVWQS